MTFVDTKASFHELRKFIRNKISLNTGIISEQEEDYFLNLMENSALSHGSYQVLVPIKGYGNIQFKNISTLIDTYLNACALANYKSKAISLVDSSTNFKRAVEHKVIWQIILVKLSEVKPHALEEAIHMSAEKPIREPPTSYKFSSH